MEVWSGNLNHILKIDIIKRSHILKCCCQLLQEKNCYDGTVLRATLPQFFTLDDVCRVTCVLRLFIVHDCPQILDQNAPCCPDSCRLKHVEQQNLHTTRVWFIPDACEECFQEKKEADHKALSDFKSAVVYVRKMSDKDIQIINSQF